MSGNLVTCEGKKLLAVQSLDMDVTREGIRNFFHPVSQTEMADLRDDLSQILIPKIRLGVSKGDWDWKVLRILIFDFIREAFMLYQAVAIRRRSQEAGFQCIASDDLRIHSALARHAIPGPPMFIVALKRGLTRPPVWIRLLRPVRNGISQVPFLSNGEFQRKFINNINEDEIVAFSSSPFMEQHARFMKNRRHKLVLCSLWEWMWLSEQDQSAIAQAPPVNQNAIAECVQGVADIFSSHGEPLSPHLSQYFVDLLTVGSRLVRFYYERLLQKPRQLPKTLWYGSTNNAWSKLLRAAVWESGGKCVGHDHGRGISLCPNRGEHGAVLDLCDEYVAYSPFLAKAFSELDSEISPQLFERDIPHFIAYPNCTLTRPERLRRSISCASDAGNRRRSVLFIAGAWLGERLGFNLLPQDLVVIDWHARLFAHLEDWGFDLTVRLHPVNVLSPPKGYLSRFSFRFSQGRLVDAINAADLVVFDFLSSPFNEVIFSDKALIFVDFGFGALGPEIQDLLKRRVAIVTGHYDEANRAQVDWEELHHAMETAGAYRDDRSCAKAIYGIDL